MRQLLLVACLVGCAGGCQKGDVTPSPPKEPEVPPVSASEVNARLPEGMLFDGERFFGRTGSVRLRLVPKTDDWVWDGRVPSGLVYHDTGWHGDVLHDGRLEMPSGLIANEGVAALGPPAFAAIKAARANNDQPAAQSSKLYHAVASTLRPADELICVIPPVAGRRGVVVAVVNKRAGGRLLLVRCAGWFTKAGGDWRVDAWHEFMTPTEYGPQPRTNYVTAVNDFRSRGLKSWSVHPDAISFQDVSSANGVACGLMKRAAEQLAAAGY